MGSTTKVALLLAIAVLSGCVAADRPVSFPEQMARESDALPSAAVSGPNGSFSTTIRGRLSRPIRLSEDGSSAAMVIEIGAARPVECLVFSKDLDLASTAIELSQQAFVELDKRQGPILSKRVYEIAASSIGVAPQLAVSWRFRSGPGVGLIKHRIASVEGHGLYCRHVAAGYRATFERVFDSIVRNMKWNGSQAPAAHFRSVSRVDLRGKPRGVATTAITDIDDDTVRIERRFSILTTSAYGNLSALDTVLVGFSRRDGTLLNAVFGRVEDRQVAANLSLEPADSGWLVSGQLSGADISVRDEEKQQLLSPLGELHSLRDAMRKRGASNSFDLHGWYPDLAPQRPVRRMVVLGKRRDPEHFEVISKIDKVVVESVVDLEGQTTQSRWLDPSIGLLETELLHTRGRIESRPKVAAD